MSDAAEDTSVSEAVSSKDDQFCRSELEPSLYRRQE